MNRVFFEFKQKRNNLLYSLYDSKQTPLEISI